MSVPNMRLYQPLGLADTTVTVQDPNLSPSQPGVITIESEQIHYASCDPNNFYNCTRAFNGTTAATHAKGVTVSFTSTDDATGVGDLVGTTPITVTNGAQTLAGQSATVALANSTVTPGSYTSANITVDAKGRVTAAANGSSTPPGGSTTQVQFNSSGAFAGDPNFTWAPTSLDIGASNITNEVLHKQSLVYFRDATDTKAVNISAPAALSFSYPLRLPIAQGGASTVLQNDGSGNLSWGAAGGTSKLVNTYLNTIATTTNTTNAAFQAVTGYSQTLTLTNAANKVIINASGQADNAAANEILIASLFRDGVEITPNQQIEVFDSAGRFVGTMATQWSDAPGDTAAHTYTLRFHSTNGGNVGFGKGSFNLQEVIVP